MILGLLLAGGASSRFGTEKAVAPYAGGVLMDRPLAALQTVCEAVAVSVRPRSGAACHARDLALICLSDSTDDAHGPLAGIHSGLIWATERGADWLATAPCDTPGLTTEHYRALLAMIDRGAPAAVSRSPRGIEPLIAIWPVRAGRDAVAAAMADGHHPAVSAVLETLKAVPVDGFDGRNINAVIDLLA